MALSQAYAVDGALLPASILRMIAWAATSGANGVVGATDLQVKALDTPGGAVNVMPGGFVAVNRYTGTSASETYAAVNDAAEPVTVPATGSAGGRTDYLIAKITDFNVEGQKPTDPDAFPTATFELVSTIDNLTYPFVALAKIVLPASTATITDTMITDLREVALPREQTVIRPIPAVAADTGLVLNNADGTGEWFPNGQNNTLGPQNIYIPEWATRAQIMCTWIGVKYAGGLDSFGQYWVEWGDYLGGSVSEQATQHFLFDSDGSGTNQRANWILGDDVYIPAKYRGTTQQFVPKATYTSTDKGVSLTATSGMLWQVRFLEVADVDAIN